MTYEKYVELVSKEITATTMPSAKVVMTAKEVDQIAKYEAAQPFKCPQCGQTVISSFQPKRIVHDVEACAKSVPPPKQ